MNRVLVHDGFFAETFPVYDVDSKQMKIVELPEGIGELSEEFEFNFENTGVMKDGVVYTTKTMPKYEGNVTTLGDIMEKEDVSAELAVCYFLIFTMDYLGYHI